MKVWSSLVVGVAVSASVAWGDVKMGSLFQDHMVLQRGQQGVPVWGHAEAGEEVTVTLAEQSKKAVADGKGDWVVKLDEMKAGGPWVMEVKGKKSITLKDVMVGEVWVCSGQSNMEFQTVESKDGVGEVARANWPNIRLFHVPRRGSDQEQRETDGHWAICTPKTVSDFSAVGYFFGREIHQKLDRVAVGLIESSVGGTPAESWTPTEALNALPEAKAMMEQWEKDRAAYPERKVAYDAALKEYMAKYASEPQRPAEMAGWENDATDVSAWGKVSEPGPWQENAGWKHNGVVWLRRNVDVPAEWAGKDLILELGRIDDRDVTYFDGQEVGRTWKENPLAVFVHRKYTVPGKLVKAGRNVIAVRVWDSGAIGGLVAEPKEMRMLSATMPGAPVPLEGEWRWKVETELDVPAGPQEPRGPGNMWTPASLWDGMVRPLVPYGVKGAIWYQGESNADRAEQYRTLFPAMIEAWRKAWGQEDFPFLFVQLANFGMWHEDPKEPAESTWAELREAQSMTLKTLQGTGMAVTVDIGDKADIHPKNKQEVGRRLALAALAGTYGKQEIAYAGPTLQDVQMEGQKVRLKFRPGAEHLEVRGGELKGFAVAGEDHTFYRARAHVEGLDQVVLIADEVKRPVAVRYGWADNPAAGLFNSAGLPASPFRTDSWPGITAGKR